MHTTLLQLHTVKQTRSWMKLCTDHPLILHDCSYSTTIYYVYSVLDLVVRGRGTGEEGNKREGGEEVLTFCVVELV